MSVVQPAKVSIRALGAANMVAQAIEGYLPESLRLYDREIGSTIHIDGRPRACEYRDFIELQFTAPGVRTARVTIERPRRDIAGAIQKSGVTWSTGGRSDLASAKATADLLAFAVDVAKILDDWADRGELARLRVDEATGETIAQANVDAVARGESPGAVGRAELHGATAPDFTPGDAVEVEVAMAGRPDQRPAGWLAGTVLNVGAEVDVVLDLGDWGEDAIGEVEYVLSRSGGDVTLMDLKEQVDGREVYVLRNCQRESVKPVAS